MAETYQMYIYLAVAFGSLEVISHSRLSSSVGCCLCLYCDTAQNAPHLYAIRLRWLFTYVGILASLRFQRLLLNRDEPSGFGMDLSGVTDVARNRLGKGKGGHYAQPFVYSNDQEAPLASMAIPSEQKHSDKTS